MLVRIPGLLRSYTRDQATVHVDPPPRATLDDVLRELDRRYPGVRFRLIDEQTQVRRHIKLFIDGALERDLGARIDRAAELMIVGALSGG